MTADLAPLGHLQGDVTGRETWAEYRTVIETAITTAPRSLQTRIGPSELGNTCDACLVLKLVGTEETRDAAWLPTVGTAVHAWLEDVFVTANAALPKTRYLVETTVSVGVVGGVDITGHADLYDLETGVVTDWKVVGESTLRNVRGSGDSATYKRQKHLYGRGFTRRGLTVTGVQTAYLPRNKPSLRDAVIVHEPYDEQIALDTLARADRLAGWVAAMGLPAVLAATGGHNGQEFSCSRFDPSMTSPGSRGRETFSDLLTVS